MSNIPRISLKNLESKDFDTIKELKDALEHHGFFALYDHSIDLKIIEKCYKKSKEFFPKMNQYHAELCTEKMH